MRWLLIGYMFLFIDRPFEVWQWLGDLHVERVYMLITLAAWVMYPNKRWLPNLQHAAYAAFAMAVILAWIVSPWAEQGQHIVEDWFKIVVFYVLLVTTIHDEEGLKHVAAGFLAVMGLYLLHSLREYIGGRFTFRMGISRMIGVDSTLGDPNSFGASIVFSLPIMMALWKSGIGGKYSKPMLAGYFALSCLCILLTGSRSSLIGLVVWCMIAIWGTRYRFLAFSGFLVAAPLAFMALPEELQTRFETVVNPEVGPANAEESRQGRIVGFTKGMELWEMFPMTGIGPGAWRPATGSAIESHNLYGQLLGETGTLGGISFLSILVCFWMNLRAMRRDRKRNPERRDDLIYTLSSSVTLSLFLLLFMGNFGHNLWRFTWLWYGGFLIVARHCVTVRAAEAWDAEPEPEPEPLPEGWVLHSPH